MLPATLPGERLRELLDQTDAAAILKVGRRLAEVRAILAELRLLERAIYVERASSADERVMPLLDVEEEIEAPYFSLILVPPGS